MLVSIHSMHVTLKLCWHKHTLLVLNIYAPITDEDAYSC
jgi:hypothetical protein